MSAKPNPISLRKCENVIHPKKLILHLTNITYCWHHIPCTSNQSTISVSNYKLHAYLQNTTFSLSLPIENSQTDFQLLEQSTWHTKLITLG